MQSRISMTMPILVLAGALALPARAADTPIYPVHRLDSDRGLQMQEGDVAIVPEGPNKTPVARFENKFAMRIDLPEGAPSPGEFELLKLAVRSDAHGFLVVSLENFPQPGLMSNWYVLDSARGELPWHTICVDLNKLEEVAPAGKYKGMENLDPTKRGIIVRGYVTDIKRSIQGPGRSLWLSDLRLARREIELDWDQARAPTTWEPGQDLACTFPLTLTNRTDKALRATIRLAPIEAPHARAVLTRDRVELAPGGTVEIEARLSLPDKIARESRPLYCERFRASAQIEGRPDSEVSILRSSDEIPLSITVPIPEERLRFPLLPRMRTMPEKVTALNANAQAAGRKVAEEVEPADLVATLDPPLDPFSYRKGFYAPQAPDSGKAAVRYSEGLTACAWLYDATGNRKFLDKGTALLLKAADMFPDMAAQWKQTRYSPISCGVFAPNVLYLGWATGSMRAPYHSARHGIFNDFDLLAADMPAADRERIIADFLVPAAIQMRNHYVGLTNQQDVSNYPVMYAGLVARNWPLVSHAYDSSHGVLNQIRYGFSDDGLAGEGNYHRPAIDPILYTAELLLPRGIDLYDDRLYSILHSRAAEVIQKGYTVPFRDYVDEHRYAGKSAVPDQSEEGAHLETGVTLLRSNDKEVGMNWGNQLNRDAPDRCALRISELRATRNPAAKEKVDIGGGNYTHSSLGQSIVIVDESRQEPLPAAVLGYAVSGPLQYVCAQSDRHYPGSTITRTFALLGGGVLVLDRVTSDQPRTVDWCLKDAGSHLSLKMKETRGGFTEKPDDTSKAVSFGANLKFDKHYHAATDETWRDAGSRLTMAAAPGTEVFTFHVAAAFSAGKKANAAGVPVLMVRRREVKQADFVAFLSDQTRSVAQTPVVKADGTEANALGATIVLKSGQAFDCLVNFEPGTEVRLGKLTTKELFATDLTPHEPPNRRAAKP